YDLKDVKERILDFLAVLQLKKNSDRKSPILCFIGPPGVGKTSLGQSIAKAMRRNFVRMSLGGIRDEAEIRGHRRTYVGSLPGRIIQGIKKANSSNPVFMLDEIDKIGADFRGDPAAALLEVLDPAQNNSFNDHYLEVDFDLSSVLFIATANISDTIPSALLDRMEMIHLPGYTTIEKIQIANNYLIPRQLKENGLADNRLVFPAATVKRLINDYTLESGVRNLERSIGAVCRKFARDIVSKKRKLKGRTQIKDGELVKYLGPKKFFTDVVEGKGAPGLVTGMAWTSFGGAIMPVEIRRMPGKGGLKMTGSLGHVMKESAEIAFSYIRSCHDSLDLPKDIFTKSDFHIHVPDGATPKDGPSAGITMLIAIISLLKNRTVNPKLAMTGEINLQGKITPVGGIREKVIAALAAGVQEVILPEKNKSDLRKLPEEVKKKIKFRFFSDIMGAAKYALGINKKLTINRKKSKRSRRK
nr:endopeptidase La [Victivallales bacterium]